MPDKFPGAPGRAIGASEPATDAAPVATNDATDLPGGVCKALVIGTAGDLKVTTRDGSTVTLVGVPAGILPLRVSRVWAVGTTAANISALY